MFHSKTNSSAARRVQRAEVRPRRQKKHIFIAAFSGLAILVGALFILDGAPVPADNKPNEKVQAEQNQVPAGAPRLKPDTVKAIYVTMHTAGRKEVFSKLIDLADGTEIMVKDYARSHRLDAVQLATDLALACVFSAVSK